jgi:hypothetical protein
VEEAVVDVAEADGERGFEEEAEVEVGFEGPVAAAPLTPEAEAEAEAAVERADEADGEIEALRVPELPPPPPLPLPLPLPAAAEVGCSGLEARALKPVAPAPSAPLCCGWAEVCGCDWACIWWAWNCACACAKVRGTSGSAFTDRKSKPLTAGADGLNENEEVDVTCGCEAVDWVVVGWCRAAGAVGSGG